MSNPISDALDALTAALQAALGAGTTVSRDPAVIGPHVAADGVAVLVGPATSTEASGFRTWMLDVPVSVCFESPADQRHIDPAYGVAHQIMSGDYIVLGMDTNTVQVDGQTNLPAVVVTLQTTTEC